jgi:tetratricopeptide (TPR) repeat protein
MIDQLDTMDLEDYLDTLEPHELEPYLKNLLKKDIRDWRAVVCLTNYYYCLGLFEEADKAIDYFIHLAPKDAIGYYMKACIHFDQGKHNSALYHVKTASHLAKENYEIIRMYGMCLYTTWSIQAARTQYEVAFALYPLYAQLLSSMLYCAIHTDDITNQKRLTEYFFQNENQLDFNNEYAKEEITNFFTHSKKSLAFKESTSKTQESKVLS